ncbi:MAG: UDPGP type 1 family protein [Fuerstiella sp.]
MSDLQNLVQQYGQAHLLRWWDELSSDEQANLEARIREIDFETIRSVWQNSRNADSASASDSSRADRAQPPRSVVYQPQSDEDRAEQREHAEIGQQLLADGKVGVITVAGGQGSRLGFDQPKGMFPIGPVTDRTLFRIFAEQILARRRRHRGSIPWLIMTSAATHQDTVDYFETNGFFDLGRDSVHFFQQGSMPAVDDESGRILMASKSTICLSPDGHGGLVTALDRSGLLKKMIEQNVEHLFYHQVDNPTVIMCDPVLIGLHHAHQSQLTTNVVRKREATEKMGVLAEVDGRTEIIEYSELTPEQAAREDENGQWVFWAGNTAIHVFRRDFFEELASDGCRLELHVAHKKVAHIDEDGKEVYPEEPNANKFERFIFDALPLADRTLIVEGDRDREFNPVKNADGNDSPATAKAALNRIAKAWLQQCGVDVANDADVEISPLQALDADELCRKIQAGEVDPQQLQSTASA